MQQPHRQSAWQEELSDLITCPKELWQLLQIPGQARDDSSKSRDDSSKSRDDMDLHTLQQAHQLFPVRLPRSYWQRLQQLPDPRPLLKQFIPSQDELVEVPGYSADPLHEAEANQVPGLLHKYPSRVLLTVTKNCAVHCRYCFRRHFNYQDNNPGKAGWSQAMAYIKARGQIQEVIFSGGDPLSLTDAYLGFFIEELQQIDHVTTLRLHTRLPAIIPLRLNNDFLQTFAASNKQLVMVLHINHPLEIDAQLRERMQLLRANGWTLLNQAVLLAGVNDELAILEQLSNELFQAGILPYYLHLPDKILGTHHFAVAKPRALQLHQELQGLLPGYLVPHLVQELAGEQQKTRL